MMNLLEKARELSRRRDLLSLEEAGGRRYFYFDKLRQQGLDHVYSSVDSNLKTYGREELPELKADWQALLEQMPRPHREYYFMRQIHSSRVEQADADGMGEARCFGRIFTEADGLMTRHADLLLSSSFGDCAPLLFLDPEHGAQANVHSGWRGSLADIGGETVRRMGEAYGSRPEILFAAIGPHIGRDDFEVSQDVAEQFSGVYPELLPDLVRPFPGREGKYLVDLTLLICANLLRAGMKAENILSCGRSTFAEPENFHSFRRDKAAFGLMMLLSQLGERFDSPEKRLGGL